MGLFVSRLGKALPAPTIPVGSGSQQGRPGTQQRQARACGAFLRGAGPALWKMKKRTNSPKQQAGEEVGSTLPAVQGRRGTAAQDPNAKQGGPVGKGLTLRETQRSAEGAG